MTIEAGAAHLTNAKINMAEAVRVWADCRKPSDDFNNYLQAALVESQLAQTELLTVIAQFCANQPLNLVGRTGFH